MPLTERSISSIGMTGGVPTQERVIGSILTSRLEPKELVIVVSRL